MDKKGLYDLLDQYQMTYEACEHPAVYTIEEMDALNLPHSERVAKNLFLRAIKSSIIIWLPCRAIKPST